MSYTLPALACDEEELHAIQSAVIPALLNQLGAHSKLPLAIRHGPHKYACLALTDLRTESGLQLLKALRNSIFANTEHGRTMITSIKTSQLESGLDKHLLLHPSIHVSYLTPMWATSICQYLHNHNMSVSLTDLLLDISPACHHDHIIMNPTTLKSYTADEQYDLNLVRIHLKAFFISDIATGDGISILPTSLQGQPDNNHTSTYV